jgi:hypothetical protein
MRDRYVVINTCTCNMFVTNIICPQYQRWSNMWQTFFNFLIGSEMWSNSENRN